MLSRITVNFTKIHFPKNGCSFSLEIHSKHKKKMISKTNSGAYRSIPKYSIPFLKLNWNKFFRYFNAIVMESALKKIQLIKTKKKVDVIENTSLKLGNSFPFATISILFLLVLVSKSGKK